MPIIQIQSTVINFPDSAASPNWAEPIVQFAEAVQQALSQVVGSFDVPPQILILDNYNPASNINIPNLTFPVTDVRGAFVRYSVYRETDSTNSYEAGELWLVYNNEGAIGQKWEVSRQSVGDGQVSFTVTDTGQVQISTSALAGVNHTGKLTYLAQAVLQNS